MILVWLPLKCWHLPAQAPHGRLVGCYRDYVLGRAEQPYGRLEGSDSSLHFGNGRSDLFPCGSLERLPRPAPGTKAKLNFSRRNRVVR